MHALTQIVPPTVSTAATVVLVVLAVLVVWALGVYTLPVRRCPRCDGAGRKPGTRNRTTRRVALCPRCHGDGRVFRLGARLVHRTVLAINREHARNRDRRERDARSDRSV